MNTGRSTATISSNHAAPSHTPVDFGRPFRQVYRKSTARLPPKRMPGASADQERRIQRLEEILKELRSLTDWKKQ